MTFSDIKDIKDLIRDLVANKIDANQLVNMEWTVTDVLNQFSDIEGNDVDFYLITARHYVNEQVKNCIKKYEPNDVEAGGQIVLEGFEYLQKAYPIVRGETRVLVPIQQMTYEELCAKAQEKYTMAKGSNAHGDEIMHYADSLRVSA
jgi:hypothetical protein